VFAIIALSAVVSVVVLYVVVRLAVTHALRADRARAATYDKARRRWNGEAIVETPARRAG